MGKIRRYSCSAKNCTSVYSHAEGGVQMLTFPKDQRRCRTWVQNSGNAELLKQPKNKLYKLRFLCKAHFADNQFLNKYKTRLSKMAVPTIFSEPPLTDEEMEPFEVSDDEEDSTPFMDQVFRSITRTIDIPQTYPLSHVVVEVSELPGRVTFLRGTNTMPATSPLIETSAVFEIRTEEGMSADDELAMVSPCIEMDHTYANNGSSDETVDIDVFSQSSFEVRNFHTCRSQLPGSPPIKPEPCMLETTEQVHQGQRQHR